MVSTSHDAASSNTSEDVQTTLRLNFSRQTSVKRRNLESDDQVRR